MANGQWLAWMGVYRRWLEEKRCGSTVKNYETAWRQFFEWAGVGPGEVTPQLAEQWSAAQRGVIGDGTLKVKLAALTSFYQYARKVGLWPVDLANPFAGVERTTLPVKPSPPAPLPGGEGRKRGLTEGEVEAVIGAINRRCRTGKRDYALLALMAAGLRPGEVLGLRWGDLAPHPPLPLRGTIVLEERGGQGIVITVRKTRVALDEEVVGAVWDYLAAVGRLGGMREFDFVFTAMHGERARRVNPKAKVAGDQPISFSLASRILKKYARRVGIEEGRARVDGLRSVVSPQGDNNSQ